MALKLFEFQKKMIATFLTKFTQFDKPISIGKVYL